MIEIHEQSRELSSVEQYIMTSSDDSVSLKDLTDGTSFQVDAFLHATVTRDDQKPREIMSILTTDKKVVVTQSATAIRSVKEIHNLMKGQPYALVKKSGITKNGKDFVNLALDITGLL